MDELIGSEGAPAQTPDVPVEPQQAQDGSGQNGIQKRIDELTAKVYAAEAKASAAEAAMAQAFAQRVQAPVAPVVDEVDAALQGLESYSPEVAQTMRKALAAVEQRVSKQTAAIQQTMRASAAGQEVAQLAQSKGMKDPRVIARAQALYQDWQAKGLSFNAVDAMTFAAGEFSMNPQQPRQVDGRFAPLDAVVTAAGAPPVQRTKGSKPQNFESLSPGEQIQWFDANGIGDKEF